MNFTSVRKIDDVGRISVPVDIRKYYGFSHDTNLKFISNSTEIIIAKSDSKVKGTKSIDGNGRLLIPKNIRTKFQLNPNTNVLLIPREDGIHLSAVK